MLLTCVLALMLLGIVYCIVMIIKSEVTYRQSVKIINGIYNYGLKCIDNSQEQLVTYSDMKSFDETLYSLFDWGYKNILPKDKFEIIEPFIPKGKQPECYGELNTPNGMAENGCEDCEYARMCEVKRKAAALHEGR